MVKQTAALKLASAKGIAVASPSTTAILSPSRSRSAPASNWIDLDRRQLANAAGEGFGGRPEPRTDLEQLGSQLKPVDRGRHQLFAHVAFPRLTVAIPVVQAVHVAENRTATSASPAGAGPVPALLVRAECDHVRLPRRGFCFRRPGIKRGRLLLRVGG